MVFEKRDQAAVNAQEKREIDTCQILVETSMMWMILNGPEFRGAEYKVGASHHIESRWWTDILVAPRGSGGFGADLDSGRRPEIPF
jgi:hypothetical protein